MKNPEINTSQKSYNFINKSGTNSYPDIITQVDKVIDKYKTQIELIKQKKATTEENLKSNNQYYPTSDKKNSNYPQIINTLPNQYINNMSGTIPRIYNKSLESQKYSNTENNYKYNNLKEVTNNEKNEYNFDYKNNIINNFNSNNYHKPMKYPSYDMNNDLNNDINYEMKNDNIKLGSALTFEKTKVVELSNLLKIKDNEISNLKQTIENFEEKIKDIENKYQSIIYSIEQEQKIKLNDIYNNMSDEQNKIKVDFDEIKRNNEIQIGQINNELYINKKIVKIFFDLFNKHIDLFNKTEILQGINNISEKEYSEETAYFAVETMDKLIIKLFQDNKDLFNELIRLKEEVNNSNIIMEQNNNYIQQENTSLRKLVHNLTNENNLLKYNNSQNNLRTFQNINNNYHLQQNNRDIRSVSHVDSHHNNVRSVCRHFTPDRLRSYNKGGINDSIRDSGRDVSPMEKLKMKINNLEEQLKSQTYY